MELKRILDIMVLVNDNRKHIGMGLCSILYHLKFTNKIAEYEVEQFLSYISQERYNQEFNNKYPEIKYRDGVSFYFEPGKLDVHEHRFRFVECQINYLKHKL